MKYNFTPLLTLFSAALIGGVGLSLATSDAPPTTTPSPQSPASISGKYCVSAGTAIQLLAAKPNADGSLDFGLSVWFENGQHCGLTGKALPGKNGGWRYEENMSSTDEQEPCGIDITSVNGQVVVNADEKASCRFACGGGAAISNLEFPPDSLENPKASSDLLTDPETLFNASCTPQP